MPSHVDVPVLWVNRAWHSADVTVSPTPDFLAMKVRGTQCSRRESFLSSSYLLVAKFSHSDHQDGGKGRHLTFTFFQNCVVVFVCFHVEGGLARPLLCVLLFWPPRWRWGALAHMSFHSCFLLWRAGVSCFVYSPDSGACPRLHYSPLSGWKQ